MSKVNLKTLKRVMSEQQGKLSPEESKKIDALVKTVVEDNQSKALTAGTVGIVTAVNGVIIFVMVKIAALLLKNGTPLATVGGILMGLMSGGQALSTIVADAIIIKAYLDGRPTNAKEAQAEAKALIAKLRAQRKAKVAAKNPQKKSGFSFRNILKKAKAERQARKEERQAQAGHAGNGPEEEEKTADNQGY